MLVFDRKTFMFVSPLFAFSCMRTGTEGSQTVTSCRGRTAWWWCGTMTGAGVTYRATTTFLIPARKAPVSKKRFGVKTVWRRLPRVAVLGSCATNWRIWNVPTASCGPPPKVRNASIFGKVRQRYETNAVVRYHCHAGFRQRLHPVSRCLSGGRWDRPQILCIPGKDGDQPEDSLWPEKPPPAARETFITRSDLHVGV